LDRANFLDKKELNILRDLSRRHHEFLVRCASGIAPGDSGRDCEAALAAMLDEGGGKISPVRLDINRNATVCHSRPDDRPFEEGDIITLDLVLEQEGLFADGAWSLICGEDLRGNRDLLEAAFLCARQAFLSVTPGETSLQMKKDLHELLRGGDVFLLEDACGHGIGREIHGAPDIRYGLQDRDDVIWEEGMVFTSEPVVTRGETTLVQDGCQNWVTRNGGGSAFFEHMCLIEGGKASCLNIPEIKNMNCIDIF
jgi:methionyl aminopeptidase